MEQQSKATVVMLRGHGEERLRQAIQQGLVRAELEQDFNEVLERIETLRDENEAANENVEELQKQLRSFKALYYKAILAKRREDDRKRQIENVKGFIIAVAVLFAIALMCTLIAGLIFG